MKRKMLLVVFLCFVLSSFYISGHQGMCYARSMLLTDAENEVCPVTGKEITRKRINTGYRGKRYWLSSHDALRKFKEDPSRYVDASGELKESSDSSRARSPYGRSRW